MIGLLLLLSLIISLMIIFTEKLYLKRNYITNEELVWLAEQMVDEAEIANATLKKVEADGQKELEKILSNGLVTSAEQSMIKLANKRISEANNSYCSAVEGAKEVLAILPESVTEKRNLFLNRLNDLSSASMLIIPEITSNDNYLSEESTLELMSLVEEMVKLVEFIEMNLKENFDSIINSKELDIKSYLSIEESNRKLIMAKATIQKEVDALPNLYDFGEQKNKLQDRINKIQPLPIPNKKKNFSKA
ncbi:hypothetical protein KUG02_06480 [Streptococcus equi subsp. zooepidemicus]|uniref:GA-like domain-containing protein n=1 Tax=Streptococcus equi TaxID=1336 RepID=UPI0013F6724A|nr:hypothetical protein [Streptococcus equi]MCD3433345.1 hypothetical protein [Streptococcus equi subsp. zooepidemicus]MDI5954003.1 hypothetical protein [Streptococcus equi subsp. zooepidemicus]QTZ59304.1 hypothetical protein MCPGFBBE_01409 [Streptococcus equi subsp. zooepidemicus]QUF61987.1 hypothetical protein KCL43_07280 [Streptococcus equi subsp. zooepidemicus]QWN60685.1 hypothetical protein GJ622_07030 [Streptococcus equi subsp. zooepidemicus]